MPKNIESTLAPITLLVLDVDGVLTDGAIWLHADGTESKRFHLQDGHGIKLWRRAGHEIALLSGRASPVTQHRARQLDIEYVYEGCHDKLPVLKELIVKLDRRPAQVAYVGDDLMDLPLVRYVGFGVAVADAVDELQALADYITRKNGGCGAVREVIEYILKAQGRWQALMERYEGT